MIRRLLALPFQVAGFLFSLVFVVGMTELFGMMLYLQWKHEAAFEALTADGVTPAAVVEFLLASPDRLAVAGGLAVLGVLLAVTGDSSGRGHHAGGDFDGDDGFGGGFGGDGGDGGGGDGGGDGGGGE
ncbi:MAG TPA: hypothetical protein VJ898_05540 [Natrialbaceae archaeon]|nr:hypothetical protein [Natrialbaceae archaeon]